MNSPVWKLVAYSLIPAVCMSAAGALAAFHKPSEKLRNAILHFAAGIVFAAVGLELLPKIMHAHATMGTAAGFTLGTAAMLGLRSLSLSLGKKSKSGNSLPLSLLAVIGVDILVDGCLIGVGFATGGSTGLFLTIALAMEAISLGLSLSATLAKGANKRGKVIGIISGIAAMFTVGAVAGGLPLQNVSPHNLAVVISFGSAALLFLVTEELLTEAHEIPESPLLTAAFFGGFLAYLLLELLGGPHS